MKTYFFLTMIACVLSLGGCHGHSNRKACITAVSLNNNDCHWGQEAGIPFYLPKPLLIVSKNFRNIEEAKVGLTDTAPIPNGYDDQSKYADVNARTNFNFGGSGGTEGETQSGGENAGVSSTSGQHVYSESGAPITPLEAPSDGLGPDTFYTYHIVFVPDLTQKYGLRIRGGPGEIRAAMNLVNGWQYTGMGPYYSKDSSSAQNIIAGGISARLGGQAARDVLTGVADLAGALPAGGTQSGGQFDAGDSRVQRLSETIKELDGSRTHMVIPAFAEIHVFEPNLGPDGMMTWSEIASCVFNREYLGIKTTEKEFAARPQTPAAALPGGVTQSGGATQSGSQANSDAVAKSAIAAVFGVAPDSAALQTGGATQSGGEFAAAPAGGVNQVNVTCEKGCQKSCCAKSSRNFSLLNLPHPSKKRERAKVERKIVKLPSTPNMNTSFGGGSRPNDPGVSGTQSGGELPNQGSGGAVFNNPTLNQPTLNQPKIIRDEPQQN